MPLADLWPSFRAAWILHEDDDVIVVDKPFGAPTHAPEPGRLDDAHSRLLAFLRERDGARPEPYLGIHQRLDRDTSGVLLFTRRKEANRAIAQQFEGRHVKKTYLAGVVRGRDGAGRRGALEGRAEGTLHHRLVERQGRMHALPASAREGQEAVTRFRVLGRAEGRALVELSPETGRTHQLRAQLAAEGFPIAGDPLYGDACAAAPRLLLHAAALTFAQPTTGRPVTVVSTAPAVLQHWLDPSKAGAVEARVPGPGGSYRVGAATVRQRGLPVTHSLTVAAPRRPVASSRGEELASVEAVEAALRDAAERRYEVARQAGPRWGEPGVHAAATTAFRLLNGAGEGLPGVDVDAYGEHLVVSLSSDDATAARERVLDAAARLGAAGVYVKVRPKHASVVVDTRRDELAPRHAVRGESAPEAFTAFELGLPFEVRLGDGLSTGIFLDQRENRRRVRELAAGARVLNLFAYTGAFTVAAVAGGARSSLTVDVSRGALAWARRNLDAVGADPALHALLEADALRWLRLATAKPPAELFDLVLLDPPSFATTKQSRFSAATDYPSVAAAALRLLAPGGRLLACTNHRGLARAKFRRFLHEAARDAGRDVAQMKDLPDPADYPPEPGREPHLKSVLVTLAGARAG